MKVIRHNMKNFRLLMAYTIAFGFIFSTTVGAGWLGRHDKSLWFMRHAASLLEMRQSEPLSLDVYEDSSSLTHTAVVPTFDSPMPKGKNVIWCASFQLAWDKLAEDVLHGPVQLANAPECIAQLNSGKFTGADLPENSYLAMAGLCRDGIAQKILDEMQRRFHRQPRFDLTAPENNVVAFAYLEANVPFVLPYCEATAPLSFHTSRNGKTPVKSFGISGTDIRVAHSDPRVTLALVSQYRILYCDADPDNESAIATDFVIDPCRYSKPNQIILACVHPAPTLEKTWQHIAHLTAKFTKNPRLQEPSPLDCFIAPEMAWDITHHFSELTGTNRMLLNKGFDKYFLGSAVQSIRFRLDRGGAKLSSEAALVVKSFPRQFEFDRPFFIFVKKRDGKKPFFAMYVDNAELLQKWKAEK